MSRVSRVTAAATATVLTGVLAVSTLAPASPAAARAKAQPVSFRVGTFNVLGASHTVNSKRWDSGITRIARANKALDSNGVDVVGFQELQEPQLSEFLRVTRGAWAVYPGTRLLRRDSENSIGWRTNRFELLQATTVNIPYFNGNPRAMPLVLLREKATGMMVYVTNYHNPASTARFPNQEKWRAKALTVQIALQNQLYRRGIPRLVTGDMNDREAYFCQVATRSPVKAARPNTYVKGKGTAKKCYANRPRSVDWIVGSRLVTFSGYVEDRSSLVKATTNHPLISSKVTVDPARMPDAWNPTPPAPVVPKVSYTR